MTESWIALLRGVNVGGIAIRSADLRALFDGLGYDAVRTVLASGNVTFRATGSRAAVKRDIEAALRTRFAYDAWILLVTDAELRIAIDEFPFDADDASRQPWVIFCADDATRDELVASAASVDPVLDPVAAGPGVVYWNPPKGATTDTAFAKVIARRTYRERTTNRNLRTLRRITG